jgi:hypothetical protein
MRKTERLLAAGLSSRPRGSGKSPIVGCIVIVIATLLTGCGLTGHPTAGEIDVRTLQVGSYPVDRFHYELHAGGNGPMLEGIRMSAAVVPGYRIDPSVNYGVKILVDPEDQAAHLLSDAARSVLARHNMVIGYATAGADRPVPAGETPPAATMVLNLVLRFPDSDTAALAARELEDADFGPATTANRTLVLPQYPEAYLHYRPGEAVVGGWLAHHEFVLIPTVQRPTADEHDLLDWIRKCFDAEIPALDRFQPTPMSKLDTLPVDPDGLLARAVVSDRGKHTSAAPDFANYATSALVASAPDEAGRQRLFDDTGVDEAGLVDTSMIVRSRDSAAAARLVDGLIATREPEYDPHDSPVPAVPGVQCLQLNAKGTAKEDTFRCYVPYKRYVARIFGSDESDLKQKVAAQYSLLANSL